MQEEEVAFSFPEKNGDDSYVSRAFTLTAFGAMSSEPRNSEQGLRLGIFPISGLKSNMHFPSHGVGSEGGSSSSSESIVGEEANNEGQGANGVAGLPLPPAQKTAWQALQESSKRRGEYKKKSITPFQIGELAKHQPGHAMRILSNRTSGIEAKKKKQFQSSRLLQREVGGLRAQSKKLSSGYAELQASTCSLEAEKKRLSERMKEVEHNIHLQEMLNESLRKDLELEYMVKIPTPNSIASFMSLSGQQLATSREAAGTSGATAW